MLSWSRDATPRRSWWMAWRISSISSSDAARTGSKRAPNIRTSRSEIRRVRRHRVVPVVLGVLGGHAHPVVPERPEDPAPPTT